MSSSSVRVRPRCTLRAASRLGIEMGGLFDRGKGGPGGWAAFFEPELHLVGQVMVPDLGGWRRARMPEMRDVSYLVRAADWVCDVLWPATAKVDRAGKMRYYAAAQVRHVWLVDPSATTLEIYRLDGASWRLVETHAGDAKVRPEPFEAVELELASLWSR